MKSFKKAVLYGFLIWLIVFATAFLIFPIHESNRAFFESIMPVIISIVTSFFAFKYFSNVENNFIKEGLYFGITSMIGMISIPVIKEFKSVSDKFAL